MWLVGAVISLFAILACIAIFVKRISIEWQGKSRALSIRTENGASFQPGLASPVVNNRAAVSETKARTTVVSSVSEDHNAKALPH